MKKLEITEEIVKDVLKNKEEKINTIHKKMALISSDICVKNDILNSVALQSKRLSDMPKALGDFKDLYDVYENYVQRVEKQKYEFQLLFLSLEREEEMIERVWLCFLALDEPYFSLLENLYVKNEKYDVSQRESGFTAQPYHQKRKDGIKSIIRLYNSELNANELERAFLSKKTYAPKTQKKSIDENQITMFMSIEED